MTMTTTGGSLSGSSRNEQYQDVGLSFVDFAIKMLRRLPSKRLNVNEYPKSIVSQLRTTYEESNCAISGVEVARGLSLLGHIAEGKTLKEIVKLLNIACGSKNNSLSECHEKIEKLIEIKNKDGYHLDGLRLFFEKRSVSQINNDLQQQLTNIFVEKLLNDEDSCKRMIIKELSFFGDPSGIRNKREIDDEMKIATYGKVQKVVRSDLSPDWRARFILSLANDETFYLSIAEEPKFKKMYFYDSYEKKPCYRTFVQAINVKCPVRNIVVDDLNIVEVFSKNATESMVIISPIKNKLCYSVLKDINSKKIVKILNKLPIEKTISDVTMPLLSISSPIGLRSIFDKPPLPFFGFKDDLTASRIFCPHKAEFTKIIDTKNKSLETVFPLYDYYYKCKTKITTVPLVELKTMKQLERKYPKGIVIPIVEHNKKKVVTTPINDDSSLPKLPLKIKKNINPKGVTKIQSREIISQKQKNVFSNEQINAFNDGVQDKKDFDEKVVELAKNIEYPTRKVCGRDSNDDSKLKDDEVPILLTSGEYPRDDTVDVDDDEIFNNSKIITNNDSYIQEYEMTGDVVVNTPFLYIVVNKVEQDGRYVRMINYVGKFTGVDETFDRTDLPLWAQDTP